MASIYKRKTRHGKETKNYYIKYKDEYGEWKRVKGCPDKQATKTMAAALEADVAKRKALGVEPFQNGELRLGEFEKYLRSKGDSERYITLTGQQLDSLMKGCGFTTLADLRKPESSTKVRNFVSKKPTPRTGNAYITSLKNYLRWLISEGKLPDSPLIHIRKSKQNGKRERRPATPKEWKAILKNAKKSKETVRGLTGEQRYWLYKVALVTGFRASELGSLEGRDFKKDYVKLSGENAKNGKSVNQPLPPGFKLPKWTGEVWPGYWPTRAAAMLREDLGDIPYETKDGILDFHALRNTAIAIWIRAGLPPEQVKVLARHSTITLTLDVYHKLGVDYRIAVPKIEGL